MAHSTKRPALLALGTLAAGTLGVVLAASCASRLDEAEPGTIRAALIVTIVPGPTFTINPCILGCTDMDCDDGLPCTTDRCCKGVCSHANTCEDDNPCTFNQCTVSGCAEPQPVAEACDDSNPCTLGDSCSAGACQPGLPKDCNDLNPCTNEMCDESSEAGDCVYSSLEPGTECDDQTECTGASECQVISELEIRCVGTTGAPECDDSNPCTEEVCGEVGQCANEPMVGSPCNENLCMSGQTCDELGGCSGGDEIECDDANPCTIDSCEPETGCVYQDNDGVECADGNLCTMGDQCEGRDCIGDVINCAPNDCHSSMCNTENGECTAEPLEDGTACGEEETGTCVEGECHAAGGAGGASGEGGGENGEGGAGENGESGAGGVPGAAGEGTEDAGAPAESGGGEGGEGAIAPPQTGGTVSSTGGTSEDPATGGSVGLAGDDGDDRGGTLERDDGSCSYSPSGRSPNALWALAGLFGLALFSRRRGRR